MDWEHTLETFHLAQHSDIILNDTRFASIRKEKLLLKASEGWILKMASYIEFILSEIFEVVPGMVVVVADLMENKGRN